MVGQSVCRYVRDVLTSNMDIAPINHSLVVLIKFPMPEYLHQFRPVGLCNVIFKVITKVIVGRLKKLMSKLISEVQSSFVPGRYIRDNIIVAQEIIHSMRKMKGNRGFMAIKVDLEKAYDCLNWSFIRDTLTVARLHSELVKVIMHCIKSSSLSIL